MIIVLTSGRDDICPRTAYEINTLLLTFGILLLVAGLLCLGFNTSDGLILEANARP